MYSYILGNIESVNSSSIVVDNNGIGYLIYVANPYAFKEGETDKVYVYQHIREDEMSIENELEEKCTKIDVLSDEIDSLLKQCLELNNKKQCPKCYAEIEKEVKFCPNCGEKLETEQAKEVEIIEEIEVEEVKDDKDEKSNLEKTVEVESDVKTKDDKKEESKKDKKDDEKE